MLEPEQYPSTPRTPISKSLALFPNPITNQRIHAMITRTKTPQLHFLPILNLLRIAVPPLHRHLAIRIGVHQNIKRAVTLQLRQERHRRRDLPEDRLDLGLDLDLGLLGWGRRAAGLGDVVFLVDGALRGGFFGGGFREYLDLQDDDFVRSIA